MAVTTRSTAPMSPQVTPARDPSNPPVQTPSPERARQGRNIRGMVTVLVVSIVVLLAAYGVMLALLGGQDDTSPNADIVSESNATGASETGAGAPPPVTQ